MGASVLGGNVEGSAPGETVVTDNGVTIIGADNLPSTMAAASSAMYARNVSSLLTYMAKDGAFTVDLDDELVAGVVITRDGAVIHPALTKAEAGPAAPASSAPSAPPDPSDPSVASAPEPDPAQSPTPPAANGD
jgi:H+-translocating NAD(P) transhydrogenase subunit alpha